MLKWIIFILITANSAPLIAQNTYHQIVSQKEGLNNIPLAREVFRTPIYLEDDWNLTTVMLKNTHLIHNVYTRYDINNNLLEIRDKNEIRALPLNGLFQFTLHNSPERVFKVSDSAILFRDQRIKKGLVEIVYSGKFCVISIFRIQSGNHLKTENYVLKDNQLTEISKSINKNKELLGEYYEKLKVFSKSEDLDLSDPVDLKLFFQYQEKLYMEDHPAN